VIRPALTLNEYLAAHVPADLLGWLCRQCSQAGVVLNGNDEGVLWCDGSFVQSQVHLITHTGHQVHIHL
jgi:hypothetical protein